VKKCDEDPKSKDFHSVIKEFQDLLETNTRLYLLVTEMFDEVPKKDPYNKGPSGKRIVRGYKHMLQIMNHLLTVPPSWNDQPDLVGLIAKPIYALFDWAHGHVVWLLFLPRSSDQCHVEKGPDRLGRISPV